MVYLPVEGGCGRITMRFGDSGRRVMCSKSLVLGLLLESVQRSKRRGRRGLVVRRWGLDASLPSGRVRRLLVWPSRTV
jgi:hypothetical protein